MKKQLPLVVLLSLIFSSMAFGHGVTDADKELMLSGGLLDYIWLGAKHMLTGYDHLLFIFGVIFFLTKFEDILKFITVFTVGHCITLIFATFMGITANAYLVDAVIALTVIYKGFDNIDGFKKYLKINPPNMLVLVFIFGLIHGFGLSTRLQELPLNHDELLLEILSFNIGVELGQVAALSAMMVVLSGWRKTASFARFSVASNIGLIAAGAFLFAMQINGYAHDHGHHEGEVHLEDSDFDDDDDEFYDDDHSHEDGHEHDHDH